MERSLVRKAYLGADCMISSLGFGTRENLEAVDRYETCLTRRADGVPVAAIDYERLKKAVESNQIQEYTKLEQLAILALREVVEKSGVKLSDQRSLMILSTTKGNIDHITDPQKRDMTHTAGRIATHFETVNRPIVISNACVSGVSAVVIAARLIEAGDYDNVFVVGVDLLTDFVASGFSAFKSLSAEVCRPFDQARDGLTLGEACGAVLVTCLEGDLEIAGGGISCDANHISGPSRTGDGLHFAIEAAMAEANVSVEELAFVNVHGTATPFNDEMESKALNLSSLTEVPCNSLKPYFGHTLGAAGVIEVIISAHALRNGVAYGVKGFENMGVPYQLNILSRHRAVEGDACLKTASGFGGSNAAVVLMKADGAAKRASIQNYNQIVKGAYVGMSDRDELGKGTNFAERIRNEFRALNRPNIKFFKMDDLAKLGYVAAEKLMEGVELKYPSNRVAIVMANRNSSLDCDLKHQAVIDAEPEEGASPAIFVYTLANIVAGEIAIRHKIQGECTFFIEPDKSGSFVERYARTLLIRGVADVVIYGWCDLLGEAYDAELRLITH